MLETSKNAFENLSDLLSKIIPHGVFTDAEERLIKKQLSNIETAFDTDYIRYLKAFEEITGKKYHSEPESRELFYTNQVHSLEQKIKALRNAVKSRWLQENNHMLNPKFMLKKDNIAKYMNYSETQKINDNANNYAETQNI